MATTLRNRAGRNSESRRNDEACNMSKMYLEFLPTSDHETELVVAVTCDTRGAFTTAQLQVEELRLREQSHSATHFRVSLPWDSIIRRDHDETRNRPRGISGGNSRGISLLFSRFPSCEPSDCCIRRYFDSGSISRLPNETELSALCSIGFIAAAMV